MKATKTLCVALGVLLAISVLVGAALVGVEKLKNADLKGSLYNLESEKVDLETELAAVKSTCAELEASLGTTKPEKGGTTEPVEEDFLLLTRDFFAVPEGATVIVETMPIEESPYLTEYCKVYGEEKLVGYVANITSRGIGGDMHFVIGITPDFALRGVKVMSHSETPYIGGIVLESDEFWDYLKSLDSQEWKEIDVEEISGNVSVTSGATITSAATVDAIQQAIIILEEAEGGLG